MLKIYKNIPERVLNPFEKKKNLTDLQQDFVDLGLGMFIHYGMPTFMDQDWSDPNASLSLFQSPKLDPDQWAKAAKSANSEESRVNRCG